MHNSLYVQTKYPSLTKEDCELMLTHLDQSLAVFERKRVVLNLPELQVKSMITALRAELRQHLAQLKE